MKKDSISGKLKLRDTLPYMIKKIINMKSGRISETTNSPYIFSGCVIWQIHFGGYYKSFLIS